MMADKNTTNAALDAKSNASEVDLSSQPVQFFNQKEFDAKESTETTKSYIIISSQRTGSTLLSRTISSIEGHLGFPNEYLHELSIKNLSNRLNLSKKNEGNKQEISLIGYLDSVKKIRTSADGYFGLVAQPAQLTRLFKKNPQQLIKFIDKFDKVIFLNRKDKLGQAISGVIASKSGKWFNTQGEEIKLTQTQLDNIFLPIARFLSKYLMEDNFIDSIAKNITKPKLEVFYEDLLKNKDKALMDIYKFLGLTDTSSLIYNQAIQIPEKPENSLSDELRSHFIEKMKKSN